MARDKERSINPAQAQRKLEKQKALKKGKAEAQARRNEKLARRNPDRIQKQIDDLKAIEESGQPLRPHDKQVLESLESDLRAVKKARQALGNRAPTFGRTGGGEHRRKDHEQGQGVLGKRRREDRDRRWERHDDSSDTDESVRNIPMPRDTPPPIPRQQRRQDRLGEPRQPHALPQKPQPVAEIKTVYEAAPAIRNLQQEAVNKFVPSTVRMKQAAAKGQGRLVEPEEMDRLEKSGYVGGAPAPKSASPTGLEPGAPSNDQEVIKLLKEIEEEEKRQQQNSLKVPTVEDVTDEER